MALLTVAPGEREKLLPVAQGLAELGFKIVATEGTAKYLNSNGVKADEVYKLNEGRPNISDLIKMLGGSR